MKKTFDKFSTGILEMMEASYSVNDAINMMGEITFPEGINKKWNEAEFEGKVVANLAKNVALDRQTINGYGWGECDIEVGAGRIDYKTRGGLRFGWKCTPYENDNGCWREYWKFYISHPAGEFPEGSTLKAAFLEKGWSENPA